MLDGLPGFSFVHLHYLSLCLILKFSSWYFKSNSVAARASYLVVVIQSESEKVVNQAFVILLAGKATNSCMEGRGKKCLIFTLMLLMEGSHCPRCLELR